MESKKRLIGRKLYLHWKDDMYVAIEKVPAGSKKCLEIKSHLMDKNCSGTMLCNMLEDENGNIEEEVLGAPAVENPGYTIDQIFVQRGFWMTPGEADDGKFNDSI